MNDEMGIRRDENRLSRIEGKLDGAVEDLDEIKKHTSLTNGHVAELLRVKLAQDRLNLDNARDFDKLRHDVAALTGKNADDMRRAEGRLKMLRWAFWGLRNYKEVSVSLTPLIAIAGVLYAVLARS